MNTTINISFSTVVKTVFFLILMWGLYQLLDLVLVILTAVVLASAIEPATAWMGKYKIPRVLAVILIYFLVALLFAGTFYFFIPPFLEDLSGFSQSLPQYLDSGAPTDTKLDVSGITGGGFGENFSGALPIRETLDELVSAVDGISENFFQVISAVFGGVFSLFLIIVISFYLAVQEKGIENFLGIITPVTHEKYVISLWQRSQKKIGLWLRGQLVLALIVGILVYLSLTIFGIKYAMLLAIIAAMFVVIFPLLIATL